MKRCFVEVFVLFVACSAAIGQTGIDGIGVGKKADYLQTSSAVPVSAAIPGDPGGPYHFSADVSSSSTYLGNVTASVRTPLNTQYSLQLDVTALALNYSGNFTSKAALDAAFPNGNYTIQATGLTRTLSLGSGDNYPTDIPRVTSGGSWNSAGHLRIDPAVGATLNFSNYSGYSSGGDSMIFFSISGMGNVFGPIVSGASTSVAGIKQESALTSFQVGGQLLVANREYIGELSFIRIVNVDLGVPGVVGLTTFVNTTNFIISTYPSDTLPSFRGSLLPRTVTAGGNVSLSIAIDGYPLPTAQWYKNGSPISGGTIAKPPGGAFYTSSFDVTNAQLADAGTYSVVITNAVGSVRSGDAVLTVNAPTGPSFSRQPWGFGIDAGLPAILSATATGTAPITYQWYFNDQPISGATNDNLQITSAQQANAGNYKLIATNAGGPTTSDTVGLTINSSLGVISAESGSSNSYIIKTDGSLWGMGVDILPIVNNFAPKAYYPVKLTDGVIAVSCGESHFFYLKSDGTLWGRGNNTYGQLGDGTTSSRNQFGPIATAVVAVAAGKYHTLLLKSDGSLWAMGYNGSGQLGSGTPFSQSSPVLIDTKVVSIDAGTWHSLYIKADGSLWGMGSNSSGQLGDGTKTDRYAPVKIADGVRVARGGNSYSLFIKTDGSLWGMGANNYGQLGDGTSLGKTTPVQLATGVQSVSAGQDHTLLIKTDGTLWATGSNDVSKLGDGTSIWRNSPVMVTSQMAAATASPQDSLFVGLNGTLWGVGGNGSEELGVGPNLSALVGITVPTRVAQGNLTVPAAPTGLTPVALNDLSAIRINWVPSLGATSYEIWRNTINDSASATRLAGGITNPLYFDSTPLSTSGYYWIRANNAAGTSSFSAVAASSMTTPPSISTQPISQLVAAGSSVTFTAVSTGIPSPTYQWQKNGVNIVNATSNSCTFATVVEGDAGSYRVVVTNSVGSVTSDTAVLTVVVVPSSAIIAITVD